MKKYIFLILVMLLAISFSGCNKKETMDTENKQNNEPVSVSEKILDVTVTLDASLFEGKTAEEIETAAKEKGIKKCVVNEDGSVTYTMAKSKHKEALKDMKLEIEKSFDQLINGEDNYESFVNIEVNDNCSKFDVFVNADKFSSWDTMSVLGFYMQGVYYQSFSGVDNDEIDVVVNFINNETQEILETASYREYMNAQENAE